jgi:ABC-type Fe3+ transport system permease subunit
VSKSPTNQVTDWVLRSKSRRLIAGFMGMALAISLMTVSQKVPDTWHLWIEWPLYMIFLISAVLMTIGLLEIALDPKKERAE